MDFIGDSLVGYMRFRIAGFFVAVLFLAGCAGVGNNDSTVEVAADYQQLSPTEAVVAIARRYYDKSYLNRGHNQTAVEVSEDAVPKIINSTRSYCATRNGKVSNWPRRPGSFNCLKSSGDIDFSISLAPGKLDAVSVTVLERTAENELMFSLLLSGMGYLSPQQVLEEQRQQQEEALAAHRKAEEELATQRLRDREKVSSVGATVCQQGKHMGSPLVLFGTVEQVAGERLKVFVERAILPRTPGISPGGFKQHYVWVSFMDVEPCSLVSN